MGQTLRRLGGRQPLCGIGVTSLIDLTWRPAAASAWMADSRPEPGPCTRTCTRRTPSVIASRPACSAATVTDPAVRADVHESLDVHGDFSPQRTLDAMIALDDLPQLVDVVVVEILDALRRLDARLLEDVARRGAADAEDVRETDLDLL